MELTLTMKQKSTPIREPESIADPSGLSFFAASMAFVALACTYYHSTCFDNRQGMLVLCVRIGGLWVVWRSEVGILVGLYCVKTWFVLLDLVVSETSRQLANGGQD